MRARGLAVAQVLGVVMFLGAVWLAKAFARAPAAPQKPAAAKQSPAAQALDRFDALCAPKKDPFDCAVARGVVRAHLVHALETLGQTRDQREVPIALSALDLVDEPTVLVAACRVLGAFPDEPGVGAKVLPLLFSEYPAVQLVAADVLVAGKDAARARVGSQWQKGTHDAALERPHHRAPERPDPVGLGFASYPGAKPFTPGDSMQSIASMTPDPVDKVVGWYAKTLHAKPLDGPAWRERAQRLQSEADAPGPDLSNDPDAVALKKLSEQFERTHDPKLLAKIQALGAKLQEKAMAGVGDHKTAGVLSVETPPGDDEGSPVRTARFLPLEDAKHRIERLVVVYRESAVNATVVQMIWDPVITLPKLPGH